MRSYYRIANQPKPRYGPNQQEDFQTFDESFTVGYSLSLKSVDNKSKAWTIGHGRGKLHKYFSMLIGELVEKTGLTKDTIRFYEKKGLISSGSTSRRENNYKDYSENVLEKLMLIRKLKDLGFTLNEINTFLELWHEEDASCQNLKYTFENKITLVEQQLTRLIELKTRLSESLTRCNNDECEFEKTIPSCL
jgi:DNA-binding transcriptional MerR regulator